MLRRWCWTIRNWFRSDEEKWAEARRIAFACRDLAREKIGVEIADDEIELLIRFQKAVHRNRRKKCLDEYLRCQMYPWLTPEKKREIVAELEGWE